MANVHNARKIVMNARVFIAFSAVMGILRTKQVDNANLVASDVLTVLEHYVVNA